MRRGRIPAPVPDGPVPLQSLARHLRRLKDASGLDYKQLSERTGTPGEPGYRGAATLSRAASGHRVPPLATVEAFARAASTNGEPDAAAKGRVAHVRGLHRVAALAELRRAAPVPRTAAKEQGWVAVRPDRIRSPAALARSLRRQRLQAGQPSLTALQDATATTGHRVPRSRVDRILAGTVLPTPDELTALLTALHVTAPVAALWLAALDRAEQSLRPPEPARRAGYPCADSDPAVQARLDLQEQDETIKRRTGAIRPEETYQDYLDRLDAERADRDLEEEMYERLAQEAVDDWHRLHPGEGREPGEDDDPVEAEQRRRYLRGLAARIDRAQHGLPPLPENAAPAPAAGG